MRPHSMLSCLAAIATLTAFARPADAYTKLEYNGGPVLSPVIYPVFWGSTWTTAEINDNKAYLTGLAAYLSGAPSLPGGQIGYEPVTREYGVVGAVVSSAVTVPTGSVTFVNDATVYNEIGILQSQGKLPPTGQNRLYVMFLKGFQQYDFSSVIPSEYCAYHKEHNGNYYAVLPAEVLASHGCDTHALTSHEVMEAVTDPKPSDGWVTNEDFGFTHVEGADNCPNFGATATFGPLNGFSDNGTSSCQDFIYSTTPHFAVTKVAGHVLDAVWPMSDAAKLGYAWLDGSGWHTETIVAPASQTTLNFVGAPAVVSASANRIDVFARAVNGELLHVFKNYSNNNGWTWTFKLQGGIGAPSAASYTTNRIDLAFMNLDATTGHSWSNDGGASFATENWPSRIAGAVKIVALKNAKLDVYVYNSQLRLNVKTFNNTWSGFFQLTGTSGYTGLTPGVAWSDFWFNRAILVDFQQGYPFGVTYTTNPNQAAYDGWQFWPARPDGNHSWGTLDLIGDTAGFDAAWQDWNEGAFYYSHYDMQSLGWSYVNDGNKWSSGIKVGNGWYSSPPVITRGGDGNIYVTGIGTDGCLWYNTVQGTTTSGPYQTGACGMY